MRTAIGLFCLCAFLLAGCAGMGPPAIARDRFDYVSSISDSWKRQMLLNMLKVRYADAPVFMDIASVINSYSLEGDS
jgi:starvation-inducible outer membrane lipoprotein